MSDRVRIQLQQSHDDVVPSENPPNISADAAMAALSKLFTKGKVAKNDSKWERELATAFKKATDWFKRVKQSGGFRPSRGSGTVMSFPFKYDEKAYRIDVE